MRSTSLNFSKGSPMRIRIGSMALPIIALFAFLLAGCGTANEESLGGQTSQAVPHKEGTPDFQSYGEAQKYQSEQAAKNRTKGKAKPGSKS